MNCIIKIYDKLIIVSDIWDNMRYRIYKNNVYIRSDILTIPQIKEIKKLYTDYRQFILDNHDLIKKYIKTYINIRDNLPTLEICKLPETSGIYKGIKYQKLCGVICIKYLTYKLYIYDDPHFCSVLSKKGDPSYDLKHKIQITDEPYDEETFFNDIIQYFDEYLVELINWLKPTLVKSANKLN